MKLRQAVKLVKRAPVRMYLDALSRGFEYRGRISDREKLALGRVIKWAVRKGMVKGARWQKNTL